MIGCVTKPSPKIATLKNTKACKFSLTGFFPVLPTGLEPVTKRL